MSLYIIALQWILKSLVNDPRSLQIAPIGQVDHMAISSLLDIPVILNEKQCMCQTVYRISGQIVAMYTVCFESASLHGSS